MVNSRGMMIRIEQDRLQAVHYATLQYDYVIRWLYISYKEPLGERR